MINWLLNNLFCPGLDKTDNNASFISVWHIRLPNFERLNISEFSSGLGVKNPQVLDRISVQLTVFLPNCDYLVEHVYIYTFIPEDQRQLGLSSEQAADTHPALYLLDNLFCVGRDTADNNARL